MSASDELRNLAESWVMNGDIPSHVKHDLDTLAIEVSEIERERDERRIVTTQEHGRVVQVYIDMLAEKNEENAKLRELVRQMYPGAKAFLQLGVQLGCNDTLSYDWWLQLRELGIGAD